MTPPSKPEGSKVYGLKHECLSFPEVLSQCVANIAPTLTPVMIAPLVFIAAGNGTWLAYLFATMGLIAVGLNINQFARRSASPGSLYSYISIGLGVNLGFVAGWSLIAAYLLTGMAALSGFVNYGTILFGPSKPILSTLLLYALGAGPAWYIAYTDVKLSTRLMLVLEVASMLLILILGAIVLAHRRQWWDPSQFKLRATDVNGLKSGLILAIFSFVGYESATTLGAESRHPLVNIPRAVIGSAVIAGLFFILTSYIAVLGFKGLNHSLGASGAPYNDLAVAVGLPFFGVLISIGAVVSTFACTLASINAGARVIFSLGRLGVLHSHLGRAHRANETPHHSATLASLLVFLVPAVLFVCKMSVLDIFNDLSTVATYGFLVAYALVSLAAMVYVKKVGSLTWGSVALSVISIAFLIPAFIATVYPAPAPPLNYLPYLFAAYMLAGCIWFFVRRIRSETLVHTIRADLVRLRAQYSEGS